MGRQIYETQESWAQGVITSVEADKVPEGGSPRGRNSYLAGASIGSATVGKRRGMLTMNRTAITGSPVVHGQAQFQRRSGSTFTQHHVIVSDNGRMDTMSTGGVLTTIDASAFTSGDHIPAFAIANNLLFIVNGQDRKKFNGTAVQGFGITKPGTAPTLAGGAAGNHNGTFEARVTFYNSDTGHESSAGTTSGTVTVTNKQIDWTAIPTSADAQVNARRLYLRNTATQSQFFLVTTINNNTDTTYTSDVLDSALVTLGPDTEENDPPPSGVFAIEWHGSRMFVADSTKVYYSQVGEPESFDPDFFEEINADDGQAITALHSAQDVLIVFKTNATYAIDGDTPASWTIRLVDPKIGCTSKRSVVTVEGITYWWSEQGPMRWDGANPPTPVGTPFIRNTLSTDILAFDEFDKVWVVADLAREHLIWGVAEVSQTRITMMLPFSYRLQRWESDKWDPMHIASAAVVEDSSGQPFVMMGNYGGQIFKWWASDSDGVAAGDTFGSFVASGTSASTITDGSKAFDTTGAGLIERRVTVIDSNGDPVGSNRPRITSNTATSITVSPTIQGLTNGATYTFIIGGPDFQWDTRWSDLNFAYNRKKFEQLFIQMHATASTIDTDVDVYFDYENTASIKKNLTFNASVQSAIWDTSTWDTAVTSSQSTVNKRIRLGQTGRVWKVRVMNPNANEPVTLTKVGLQAELMGTNLG